MATHPINDRLKIKVKTSEYGFSGDATPSSESGVVVEVPDVMIYLSFHSFSFDNSLLDESKLEKIQSYYNQFLGKMVYWEKLQDRGRMLRESDGEYVYLQMTDLLAYSDNTEEIVEHVDQSGSAGSFNLS